jgi:hypothetical protein
MDDGIAMLLAAQQADAKMIVNHYRRYSASFGKRNESSMKAQLVLFR